MRNLWIRNLDESDRLDGPGEVNLATTESALTGLEPRSFWGHFEALTKIARPSRHEEPAIEHVREWADQHGFVLEQDAGRNLVIRVPGPPAASRRRP